MSQKIEGSIFIGQDRTSRSTSLYKGSPVRPLRPRFKNMPISSFLHFQHQHALYSRIFEVIEAVWGNLDYFQPHYIFAFFFNACRFWRYIVKAFAVVQIDQLSLDTSISEFGETTTSTTAVDSWAKLEFGFGRRATPSKALPFQTIFIANWSVKRPSKSFEPRPMTTSEIPTEPEIKSVLPSKCRE